MAPLERWYWQHHGAIVESTTEQAPVYRANVAVCLMWLLKATKASAESTDDLY